LLLLAILAPATAVGQQAPQPVFTELFAYDPAVPSQLLGKWLISSQLDSKLQPLRVGVVEDPSGKTVGRVTVQEGDGLDAASEAIMSEPEWRRGNRTNWGERVEVHLGSRGHLPA
jgi:hypothetical protein